MSAVNPNSGPVSQPTRRERVRAATQAEIVAAARALLVKGGVEQVTLRAIAAELGMTAPALYRYYDSREHLLEALICDLYDELADVLIAARDSEEVLKQRFMVTAKAFRQWALDHRAEFGLLFGAPLPGVAPQDDHDGFGRGWRFANVWFELFVELWHSRPMPVAAPDEVDPRLRDQLGGLLERTGNQVPLGGVILYLTCWTRLYGAVCTEVFGHLTFALADAEPLFEQLCVEVADRLGLGDE